MPDEPPLPPATDHTGGPEAPLAEPTTLAWGASPEVVLALGHILRELPRAPTAAEMTARLGLQPAELLEALLDLRVAVEDFTPAFGYPRSTKQRFALLLQDLLREHPDLPHTLRDRIEALFSGTWSVERTRAAIGSLAELYDLDHRVPGCLRRVEGQVRLDRDQMRNIAIATLSSREDELTLLPAEDFERFAELWVELFGAAAIAWYERAYPTRLDPGAWAGFPTEERITRLLEDGDLRRYRHYLGLQPPPDLVEAAMASEVGRPQLLRLAHALRQASGKRWKTAGRQLEARLAEDPTPRS